MGDQLERSTWHHIAVCRDCNWEDSLGSESNALIKAQHHNKTTGHQVKVQTEIYRQWLIT